MTINELYQKALEIETKYTSESSLSLFINKTTNSKDKIRFQLKHDGTGINVDTGFGITNIKELLTVFDMGMAARYRFVNDKTQDDLEVE